MAVKRDGIPSTLAHSGAVSFWLAVLLTGVGTGLAAAALTRLLAATPIKAPAPKILSTISLVMDGRRRSFPMMATDASVLEAGEHAGLELPFSCRSGICATCRARIVGGQGVMAHNIALERWEVEAGFILCCQARPTT